MFTSFDEEKFWKAIAEKDLTRLKVNTVSAMRNDPTFERGEAEKVLSILKEKLGNEIFEDEKELEYEDRLDDRSKWDKDYFTRLTFWFQENFAESRVAHIKEVGKAVHADTAKAYAASMQKVTPEKRENATGNPTVAPENPKQPQHVWGILAAFGALVLVACLIFSLFKK